ncbi:MAG: hypothetical protein JXR51_05135 [Bacteroidales bacterium]|nr:hypothetical protein [Bacteroidales bacterium]MBN2756544.1 hypothetical protein [Bacteroidales bacterium]
MKKYSNQIILLIIIFSFFISCNNFQRINNETIKGNEIHKEYDSIKAQKFGADEYGMKKYVVAFLKRGPNRNLDSLESSKLQMAHLKNIEKMANDGKLVLAGPFFDNDNLRGIYIFNVSSIEEAENLTNSDPAIKAGSLVMELKEWYGSAALMELNEIHKTISKKQITE